MPFIANSSEQLLLKCFSGSTNQDADAILEHIKKWQAAKKLDIFTFDNHQGENNSPQFWGDIASLENDCCISVNGNNGKRMISITAWGEFLSDLIILPSELKDLLAKPEEEIGNTG